MLKLTILAVLIGTPAIAITAEYGPSILSLSRPNYSSSTTLPFLPQPTSSYEPASIYLENFPYYSTVMPLADGNPSVKSEEIIDALGREALHGGVPITVIPPKDHGIMVVIQELEIPAYNTFNRSLLVIAENGKIMKCFSKFEFQMEGKSSVEVCGRTRSDGDVRRPSVLNGVGPRSFVVPEGKSITIRFIYKDHEIDKSSSLGKQVPFYDVGYTFWGSIAFTAFRSCPHGPPFHNENDTKLWPCDIPQSEREPVAACIREEHFCNNVINCGIHDAAEFALDEKFCSETKDNTTRETSHTLDVALMEDAIRGRFIHSRPYGYDDMIIHMRPQGHTNDFNFVVEPGENKISDVQHPAFVALVVLISVICLMMLAIVFRYCCKLCVGKPEPYGDSSNPEAVARFHENLRNRGNNIRSGTAFGLSHDSLFKPVDDPPPNYDDLFPEELRNKNLSNSNFTELVITRAGEYPTASVYTVPVIQQSSVMLPSSNNGIINETTFVSPTILRLEVPGTSSSVNNVNSESSNSYTNTNSNVFSSRRSLSQVQTRLDQVDV